MKKSMLSLLIAFIMCFSLLGCDFGESELKKQTAPSEIKLSSTTTSITVTYISYSNTEFSLDKTSWQEEKVFSDLQPATEYTVYGRVKAEEGYAPSDSVEKKISTKKLENSEAVEPRYTQNGKTVIIENEEEKYEFSLNNETYTDNNEFTFSILGEQIIYVRYKETKDHYNSDPAQLKILISDFERGKGSQESPFEIVSLEQFEKINNGSYVLLNDLDFKNKQYISTITKGLRDFDGNGFTLKNINLKMSNYQTGIFSYTSGQVKNLNIENIVITGKGTDLMDSPTSARIGTLTGNFNGGSIYNCSVDGSITIDSDKRIFYSIGGLVGTQTNDGSISNCKTNVEITVTGATGYNIKAGGLIGEYLITSDGSISKSYSVGNINSSGSFGAAIGGLTGEFIGTISESYSSISIEVTIGVSQPNKIEVGGLVGKMKGTLNNCYSLVQIIVQNAVGEIGSGLGGLIGTGGSYDEELNINACYAEGFVTLMATRDDIFNGGLVGYVDILNIENSFASVNIFGKSSGNKEYDDTPSKIYISALVAYTDPNKISTFENNYCDEDINVTGEYGTDSTSPQVIKNIIGFSAASYVTDFSSMQWQKNVLKLDAEIWKITDGKAPTLKCFDL